MYFALFLFSYVRPHTDFTWSHTYETSHGAGSSIPFAPLQHHSGLQWWPLSVQCTYPTSYCNFQPFLHTFELFYKTGQNETLPEGPFQIKRLGLSGKYTWDTSLTFPIPSLPVSLVFLKVHRVYSSCAW